MPKVPMESPQVSLNVPGVQAPFTREFGKIGTAAEQTGADIEHETLSLNEQVQHIQAMDASATALAGDKIATDQKIIQLKLSSADGLVRDPNGDLVRNQDGNPRTIVDDLHDFADKRYQQSQQNMPSGIAQSMYKQSALPYLSGQIGLMTDHVQSMKVTADKQRQTLAIQAYGNNLEQNPSLQNLYSYMDDVEKNNNDRVGLVYNKTEANAQTLTAHEQMGRMIMQGAYLNVFDEKKEGNPATRTKDIHNWLDILHGKDPISMNRAANGRPTLSSAMDPMQKSVEEKHLLALLPNAGSMDKSDFRVRFDAAVGAEARGQGDPNSRAWVVNTLHQMTTAGVYHPAEAVQMFGELAAATEKGRVYGNSSAPFDALPLAARNEYMAGAENRALNYAQGIANKYGVNDKNLGKQGAAVVHDSLYKEIDDVENEKNKDYAAFSQRILGAGQKIKDVDWQSPAMAQSAAQIQAYDRAHDALVKVNPASNPLNDRAPITRDQSAQVADRLKNPQGFNETQAAKYMNALQIAHGAWTPKVVDQMIRDNNLTPAWRIALLHTRDNDLTGASAVITALRGGPEVDKLFKQMQETATGGVRDGEMQVHDQVKKAFAPYVDAQAASHPNGVARDQISASVVEAGSNYAKQLMLENRQMTPEAAAKTAYQQMIGSRVITGTVGNTWNPVDRVTGNPVSPSARAMPYVVPAHIAGRDLGPNDQVNLESNFKDWTDHLDRFNPTTPVTADGKPAPLGEHWLDSVKQNGGWVHDPSRGGFVYSYTLPQPDGTVSARKLLLHTDAQTGRLQPIVVPEKNGFLIHPQGPNLFQKIKQYLPGGISQ